MSIFNTTDKLEVKGFINKNDILKYVTEEQIFELVFGFQPKEYDYVVSPFRHDDNPGCWFAYSPESGKLKFRDFGSNIFIANTRMINIDCFDAVQIYFKLNNLYETLLFIKEKLVSGKELENIEHRVFEKIRKQECIIQFEPRIFNGNDKSYWSKFGITSSNLIEDKVFAVRKLRISTSKKDVSQTVYDICYAYTDFESGNKKIYRPTQRSKYKFTTNCTQNDIGGVNKLDDIGNLLVITKSYKDWRVLKNQGVKNTIWFQNEGMIPAEDILIPILSRFRKVVIFFDNDSTGIDESKKIVNIINSHYYNRASNLYLPEQYNTHLITDPSDLISKKGNEVLNNFLYQNNLLL